MEVLRSSLAIITVHLLLMLKKVIAGYNKDRWEI